MEIDLRTLILGLVPCTVSWVERPQTSDLPSVVLTAVSEDTAYTYSGAVALVTTRVQADIFAASYKSAREIDAAVAAGVSGYRGAVGTTDFLGIFLESRFDGDEEPAFGTEPIFRISRDLMVKHKGDLTNV